MKISELKKIKELYTIKAEMENYENTETLDICILANDALIWHDFINTEADELTFGEFTRRFENAVKELKGILLL